MADSLFDHRYRYDYIYPRGRSGETLRAVDTQDGDRPVVVKRPAPNDAPPIRAGQEVSILNERKALLRLAGHPALCALTGTGQFVVGGMPHQYIVIERADGLIIGDLVLELAARDERLPELEMLVIVDALLDLLIAAHAHEIVYNDVDAKHLFWNRETYRLKVIDWGNAVFLEGDEATPQGISRGSDIYQVGELLYFIVTGGRRVEVTRDPARAGEDFRLDFGAETERLHSRLLAIISRAAHPNPRLRYRTLADLRAELAEYAAPIARDRDALIGRVTDRLKRDLSRDDLLALRRTLAPALTADPGFPPARAADHEIALRLTDLEVAADLDAVRIYLENANWLRAGGVLDDLAPRARNEQAAQIALLRDWTTILSSGRVNVLTPTLNAAFAAVFTGDLSGAAAALQTTGMEDAAARHVQLLLAERVSSHMPELLLLRPNLYRVQTALESIAAGGGAAIAAEARSLLAETLATLDQLADPDVISLIALRDSFGGVVDRLTALNTMLEALQVRAALPPSALALNALTRALNAAMALADNMHIIGRAATSRREASAALEASREIAPGLPVWDGIAHLLTSLYDRIDGYQRYTPAADGGDIADWLIASAQELTPFTERLFDETLVSMVFGLNAAARSWVGYGEAVVQGGRGAALTHLQAAMDAVSGVSPSLLAWLGQVRTVIAGAAYIERHALNGGVGRALADGWDNFDRGRLSEAERLALSAAAAAVSEAEAFAAGRLRDLAQISRDWLERGGALDGARTQTALSAIEALYTRDEIAARDAFAAQMPSRETYLKAMSKSLVEHLARLSTAAVRLLYVQCVLNAALAAQTENETDWRFWRESAVKTLGEGGLRHPLLRALTDALDKQRDLRTAAAAVDAIASAAALPRIDAVRRTLDDNPQAAALAPVILSLRELDAAVRDWADGDFRAAGLRLENAVRGLTDVTERQPDFQPNAYRAYLLDLIAGAAELHQRTRRLAQIADAPPDAPTSALAAIHHEWVTSTARLIGDGQTAAVRRWRDMYETFAALMTDRGLRRSAKLPRFTELFTVQGIERHPAYAIYRHWQRVTEESSEFPAPVGSDPTPRVTDEEAPWTEPDAAPLVSPVPAAADRPAEPPDPVPTSRRAFNPLLIVLALAGALGLAVLIGALALNQPPPTAPVAAAATETPPPTSDAAAATRAAAQTAIAQIGVTLTVQLDALTLTAPPAVITADVSPALLVLPTLPPPSPTPLAVLATVAPRGTETPIPTLTPSLTFTPSLTPTDSPPTATRTPVPTNTRPSPTPSPTPTPTLPPNGIQGEIDLLAWADADAAWTQNGIAGAFTASTEGDFWRLGSGAPLAPDTTTDDRLVIAPSAAQLNARYGNAAPERVVRAAAQLSLITFNPALLVDQAVYFGLVLQTSDGSAQAGVEIQVVQAGIITVALVENDQRRVVSQRSDTAADLRIRLERDPATGDVIVYLNNELLPGRIPLAAAAVVPALIVHDGGVIAHVLEYTVTLR